MGRAGPCYIYFFGFREQAIFDSMRRDAGVDDAGMAVMCHVDQHGGGPGDAWQQAYTSAELLSALIPSTPFPLDDQVAAAAAARDDELDKTSTTAALQQPRFSVHELEAVMQDSMAPAPPPHVHEQVEASAGSCSNNVVPPPGGDAAAAAAAQEQQHGLPGGAVTIG